MAGSGRDRQIDSQQVATARKTPAVVAKTNDYEILVYSSAVLVTIKLRK